LSGDDLHGRPPQPGELAPALNDLLEMELLVPVRSSGGAARDPAGVYVEEMRHGTDQHGERFLAAFSTPKTLSEFGPAGSDHVSLTARELIERADGARERVVIDPGAPTQVELSVDVLPFLAAGIDPSHPDVLRAMRPLGEAPDLRAPGEVPEPFGTELGRALVELPHVERAWLLRAGEGWTAGIQMDPDATLGDFDAVRNRLHAVATEYLGSRRVLAVTDLRAPALLAHYAGVAAPYFVADRGRKGFLGRLFGD